MFLDKLRWTKISGQSLWIGLGVANLIGFGLSQYMDKENFSFYFHHKGEGRFFQPIKSMMASESLTNVAWTVPCLIGGGMWLQGQIGSLRSAKFFGVALMASYGLKSAFGPGSIFAEFGYERYMPVLSSNARDGSYCLGADSMACAILYFAMIRYGWTSLAAASIAIDFLYYGPKGVGGPLAGVMFAGMLM